MYTIKFVLNVQYTNKKGIRRMPKKVLEVYGFIRAYLLNITFYRFNFHYFMFK